ncbi:MAG: hypothetical protein KDD39_08525 [Bdellovibrionales bacterium]|nr:hypothetical protein [Bdellovibrionales bacterium]
MATRKSLLLWGLFAFLGCLAQAEDWVCVRNYTTDQGSACNLKTKSYEWVQHATEQEKPVCARVYPEFYCQGSKEFTRVETVEGEEICVMNYAQPPVANYCESAPQFYDYVLRRVNAD